jgi:membrane protein DedA with SNARE-associated domain
VVRVSALMSVYDVFKPLRYCGEHSIVIYLAFFLPMAATRSLLLHSGVISDIGTIALIVTFAGVLGALLMYWLLRWTPLSFLYERPRMFRLKDKPKSRLVLQPAE